MRGDEKVGLAADANIGKRARSCLKHLKHRSEPVVKKYLPCLSYGRKGAPDRPRIGNGYPSTKYHRLQLAGEGSCDFVGSECHRRIAEEKYSVTKSLAYDYRHFEQSIQKKITYS